MQISYLRDEQIYVATISFHQRELFKKSGWQWSALKKRWFTKDRVLVEPFLAFLDPSAREREKIWQDKIGQHVELSKKLELDNQRDFACPIGQKYDGYQEVAIEYAQNRKAVLIADPPGLGKTIEAIGIVNNATFKVNRVLLIVEASHKVHWMREWKKWNVNPNLICEIAETKKEKYKEDGKTKYKSVPYWPNSPVVIINYHQIEIFEKQLKSIDWDYMIVDEATAITNPEATITKRILGEVIYTKKPKFTPIPAERKLFLTGTPMLGKPKKMFVFARECDPKGLGKNYMTFADRYCAGNMTNFGYDDNGYSNLEELQEKMRASFMIRRSKTQALKDLPPKRRYPFMLPKDGLSKIVNRENSAYQAVKEALLAYEIELGLKDEQNDISEQVIENLYEVISERFQDNDNISFNDVVSKYSPTVAEAFEELTTARKELALAKVPMVKKISQEIMDNDEKLIMFCIHKEVAAALRDIWPQCAFVTGSTPSGKRQGEIDRFQTEAACNVAVGNIFAMGKGYTMTAAKHVDMLEMHLVPDFMEQAEDRAWRRGQKNAVTARYFVVEDTYDARNIEILIEKLEINKKGLDYD